MRTQTSRFAEFSAVFVIPAVVVVMTACGKIAPEESALLPGSNPAADAGDDSPGYVFVPPSSTAGQTLPVAHVQAGALFTALDVKSGYYAELLTQSPGQVSTIWLDHRWSDTPVAQMTGVTPPVVAIAQNDTVPAWIGRYPTGDEILVTGSFGPFTASNPFVTIATNIRGNALAWYSFGVYADISDQGCVGFINHTDAVTCTMAGFANLNAGGNGLHAVLNEVYAADATTIYKVDADYQSTARIPLPSELTGCTGGCAYDVNADSEGNLYVATETGLVLLTPAGDFIRKIPSPALTQIEILESPTLVAYAMSPTSGLLKITLGDTPAVTTVTTDVLTGTHFGVDDGKWGLAWIRADATEIESIVPAP